MKSGRFRLLEINPRSWSWLQASASSRADIAWIAYRDLCGAKITPIRVANSDPGRIKAVRAIFDVTNILFRYPKGHQHLRIRPGAWRGSLSARHFIPIETYRFDWSLTLFCLVLLARDVLKNE